jgi:hypothetical protein
MLRYVAAMAGIALMFPIILQRKQKQGCAALLAFAPVEASVCDDVHIALQACSHGTPAIKELTTKASAGENACLQTYFSMDCTAGVHHH